MAVTLKRLFSENGNPFQLSLCAGGNGIRNSVSWIYMLEDEYIIPYFHGAELAVTTCMKYTSDSAWLLTLVEKLCVQRAAGLIINIGKFIFEIPTDVMDFCNSHDFPLMIMPWEIQITQMIQDFCLTIINDRHENILHDQAIRDLIQNPSHLHEHLDTLARYYLTNGSFAIMTIYAKYKLNDSIGPKYDLQSNIEYWLSTRLSRLRTELHVPHLRIGIVSYEHLQLLIINNVTTSLLPKIYDVVLDVYKDAQETHSIFIGIGNIVSGIENLSKSYLRASTAVRMALYQNKPIVRFEDMGIYKILFSVRDDEILFSFADEILAPLDAYDSKNHNYKELLREYIRQDRSLEATAKAMFLHRNTVNYRIQKMKTLLNSPLKTLEDLFPYQVAFAIRDMENIVSKPKDND